MGHIHICATEGAVQARRPSEGEQSAFGPPRNRFIFTSFDAASSELAPEARDTVGNLDFDVF